MAVQQGYGKMAGTDALVFAYDTGDAVNSYKGEPTVNITPNHYLAWATLSGTRTANAIEDSDGVLQGMKLTATATTQVRTEFNAAVPSSESFYTFSVEGKRGSSPYIGLYTYLNPYPSPYIIYNIDTDTTTVSSNIHNYGVEYVKNGWYRIWMTVTVRPDQINTLFKVIQTDSISPSGGVTGGYVYYAKAQLEVKDHVTPFTTGSRSATEGLLDLTGTTSIDLSNVSFDSDGNIDFDGASDFIETSVITTNSSNITSISWIYLEGWDSPNSTLGLSVDSSSANGGFRVYNTSSSIGVWQRRSDTSSVTSITGNYRVPKKQWVQVTFVSDNGSGKIYINDHVAASGTFTAPGLVNGPAWVSRYSGGGYHLNGKVDNVMLFNRALSEAEIVSNFNRNKKKHLGADSLLDHTSDGGGWIRWWWYTGVGWPGHETEALGHPFGTFDSSSHYGFQRLPEGLNKDQVELLAKDGDGNIYKWDFASPSATAQQVWDSFTLGTQGRWHNAGDAWNPEVIAGSFFNRDQDAWQYRNSEGVVSFLLDDDTCDCLSTLNAGHAMCGAGWSQTYAQPDGAYLRYGVDTLNDGGCKGPLPERTLELFYRLK